MDGGTHGPGASGRGVRWLGWLWLGLGLGAVAVHLATGVPPARTAAWVLAGWVPGTLALRWITDPEADSLWRDLAAVLVAGGLLVSWAVLGADVGPP